MNKLLNIKAIRLNGESLCFRADKSEGFIFHDKDDILTVGGKIHFKLHCELDVEKDSYKEGDVVDMEIYEGVDGKCTEITIKISNIKWGRAIFIQDNDEVKVREVELRGVVWKQLSNIKEIKLNGRFVCFSADEFKAFILHDKDDILTVGGKIRFILFIRLDVKEDSYKKGDVVDMEIYEGVDGKCTKIKIKISNIKWGRAIFIQDNDNKIRARNVELRGVVV